jgi:hypothetical protein
MEIMYTIYKERERHRDREIAREEDRVGGR